MPVILDRISLGFLFTVRIISGIIYHFSLGYMSQEKFFLRFHLLVFSFIVSMVLLILSPNLVRVLLGWDGLGVTSYLLVIYFQRAKSYNAGIITALTNRIGDVLILRSIGMLSFMGSWNYGITRLRNTEAIFLPMALLVLAACTKRAQIPFSA